MNNFVWRWTDESLSSCDDVNLRRRGWVYASFAFAAALEIWEAGSIPHRACGDLCKRALGRLYGTLA